MCLFKKHREHKIADQDIECYKVLQSNLRSIYYNYPYKIGKLYKKIWDEEFLKYADPRQDIGGNMFHASLDKEQCEDMYGDDEEKITFTNSEGKEDYKLIRHLSKEQVMVKCIIPKGSKYYLGTYTEIGSEQILIKEICH